MKTLLNKPFNDAQVELIQLLAQDLNSDELAELRKLLVSFRFRLVEQRAEQITQNKAWTNEEINNLSKKHLRTPYAAKHQD